MKNNYELANKNGLTKTEKELWDYIQELHVLIWYQAIGIAILVVIVALLVWYL